MSRRLAWICAAALAALSCERETLRVLVRAQCVGGGGAGGAGARSGGARDAGASGTGADGGAPVGAGGSPSGCATYKDVWCVNFLRFFVEVDGQELTRCVPLTSVLGTQRAASFCDFERRAIKGLDLFDLAPDKIVKFSVQGLRAYPFETCLALDECPRLPVFQGESQRAKVADLAGKSIEVVVTQCSPCGLREAFITNPNHLSCDEICQGLQVICQPLGGCLCKVKDE